MVITRDGCGGGGRFRGGCVSNYNNNAARLKVAAINRNWALCVSARAHARSHKEHERRAEGVGVAQWRRGQGTSLPPRGVADETMAVSFQRAAGYYRQGCSLAHDLQELPRPPRLASSRAAPRLRRPRGPGADAWEGRTRDPLTQQRAEELALEDVDDPVQRLVQLVVLLHQALSGGALVLVPAAQLGPVLLQELQRSPGIYGTTRQSFDGDRR